MRTLEFDKVKKQWMNYVASSLGKEKIASHFPSIHLSEVTQWQNETAEASTILRLRGHVPLGGLTDVRPALKRVEIGGDLNAFELLQIAGVLYASRQFKLFMEQLVEDEDVTLPILEAKSEAIVILKELEQQIKHSIDESGHVADHASEALHHIRQQLKTSEKKIRERLEQLVRTSQKMLSDSIITIRNDRYVLPVKQEYRYAFKGTVHDQSSSGATLFIEPQSVIELNHRLQEAKVKEKAEIDRILRALTGLVATELAPIRENVLILADIDFIFAKAHYAKAIKASQPKMNDKGCIVLKEARHPLIDSEKVVPMSLVLGDTYTSLVVTGPNTGGKTVTLKTIGLLTLMAQSGLHIPAQEGSEMAVFESIFADIGDEQSIEQSLSTFSSHMTNIVQILKKVDEKSLVLFDELGAGTDPEEGAALAIAILDYVLAYKARVVATTHYSELKAYAYNREGVMNASVEFDVETLQPTYRLLVGVPGKSNAFEISKRLGLEDFIIEKAREQISTDHNKVNKMIVSLEELQKQAALDKEKAEKWKMEAEQLRKQLQTQYEEFENEKKQLLKKAEQEAQSVVDKAKQEAEEIIHELRQKQLMGTHVKEHELIEAKTRLNKAVPELDTKQRKKQPVQTKRKVFAPGEEVKVTSLGQKGFIVEKINGEEYTVQIGIIKTKIHVDDLIKTETKQKIETKPLATIKGSSYHVKTELDLRGARYEDAIVQVEKYLDDALLANYPRVSIIHGKGTGALRKGVHAYLKKHPRVKGFRLGTPSEGGSGATVVELK